MSYLDDKILSLEKELNELKKIKDKMKKKDFLNVEINFVVDDYQHNKELNFNSFNELFDYFKQIMQDNDVIAIDYVVNNEWKNESFYDCKTKTRKDIISLIATFDAYTLLTMDFGVCTIKESWKCQSRIRTPFLIEYEENKNVDPILNEKAKKYKLF